MAESKNIGYKAYMHMLNVDQHDRRKCHVGRGNMSRDVRRRCARCNEPMPFGSMNPMCARCREDMR